MIFLKAINKKTCCPPGKLNVGNGKQHIIVASLMRSGTHVAINLIINNFPIYKNNPLYVNLDYYINNGFDAELLQNAGGYVVKTHFPQTIECAGFEDKFTDFIKKNKVILVQRNHDDIKKSLSKFQEWGKKEVSKFDKQAEEFIKFWSVIDDKIIVDYSDLINPNQVPEVLKQIASYLNVTPQEKIIRPKSKKRKISIIIDKALTRLLGNRTPIVNTGIRLGK